MPELPEVEFCARRLRDWAVRRRIVAVHALPGPPLRDVTPAALEVGLRGRRVVGVDRRGKQLFVRLEGDLVLLAHLGMTGKFIRTAPRAPARPGERARLTLDDDAALAFVDPRRFGRLRLLPAADAARHPEVARLGPDALELCARPGGLRRALRRRGRGRRPIKVALMDQSVLAGVGNIYACEALFAARIDPSAPVATLSDAALDALAGHLVDCIEASLARERDDEITYLQEARATNPFRVYGRAGEPCPMCGRPLERTLQAGRGTFWCPRCQTLPADR